MALFDRALELSARCPATTDEGCLWPTITRREHSRRRKDPALPGSGPSRTGRSQRTSRSPSPTKTRSRRPLPPAYPRQELVAGQAQNTWRAGNRAGPLRGRGPSSGPAISRAPARGATQQTADGGSPNRSRTRGVPSPFPRTVLPGGNAFAPAFPPVSSTVLPVLPLFDKRGNRGRRIGLRLGPP